MQVQVLIRLGADVSQGLGHRVLARKGTQYTSFSTPRLGPEQSLRRPLRRNGSWRGESTTCSVGWVNQASSVWFVVCLPSWRACRLA